VFDVVDVQCDQSIVEDFKQICSILALLSSVSLNVFETVAESESLTVAAVQNELSTLELRLGVVLVISRFDICFEFDEILVFVELVVNSCFPCFLNYVSH